RNFEYFSEDPYLAGEMGVQEVLGVQSTGVGTSLKHFALNNSENFRFISDSIADMRTIHELYLRPFMRTIRMAKPDTVMCAYNKIRGVFCSENGWLLRDILRDEWGFTGAVMTDWGAIHDRARGIVAGVDLEMPGDTPICKKMLYDNADNPEVQKALDESVLRILSLVEKYGERQSYQVDFDAHHDLARRIAEDSAVLLKNGGSLPLSMDAEFTIIGDLFENMRYQGAGSSMICPTRLVTPKDAFDARGVRYAYFKGYANGDGDSDRLREEALAHVHEGDTVLLFLGLTDEIESEGIDRADMSLPEEQIALVDALCERGAKINIVLYGGSAIALPFIDKTESLLLMLLPGQAGGLATANLLFGDISPSGRLSETFRHSADLVPFTDAFSRGETELYKEGVFVGYREAFFRPDTVAFPFGYGLSYSEFSYHGMALTDMGDEISVTVDLENSGRMAAKEVIQVYFSSPECAVARPVRELCAFEKVSLGAGERKQVTLTIKKEDLKYYHSDERRFVLAKGEYTFTVARDAMTPILSDTLTLDGEALPSPYPEEVDMLYREGRIGDMTDELFAVICDHTLPEERQRLPITLESPFSDLSLTFFGRCLSSIVLSLPKFSMWKAKRMKPSRERDNCIKSALFFRRMIEMNTLNGMTMGSGGMMPYHIACGFVEIANGHLLGGIGKMLRPIKLPPKN
ncbi:MAG: glycoside hydrolase family 3 C-terminal domain-containing protein, partial [Clostridia bacterium]|nr:glycoside hydrolase family 3 C-terminal domain-containing protein [Clostridia bacterium]